MVTIGATSKVDSVSGSIRCPWTGCARGPLWTLTPETSIVLSSYGVCSMITNSRALF